MWSTAFGRDLSLSDQLFDLFATDKSRYLAQPSPIILTSAGASLSHVLNENVSFHYSFAGFDAVTVANNHFNDFGSEGANFTVDVLQKEGIKYFGITYGEYDSSQVWSGNL